MRHMEVKTLWIQELVLKGRLLVTKISTSENTADIGTKPLPAVQFCKLRDLIGLLMLVDPTLGDDLIEKTLESNTVVAIQVVEGASACMAGVLLGLLIGVGVWFLIGATEQKKDESKKNENKKNEKSVATQTENEKMHKGHRRDVVCQAPCTYTFRRSSPRFLPLRSGQEGAWVQDGGVL